MPRLPGIEYAKPAGPAGSVGPAQINTGASLIPQAVSELGGTLEKIGSYLDDRYTESKASNRVADAQKELQDYSFELQNGTVDEQGTIIAPPPPDQHQKLFQKKLDDIQSRAENDLGGRALNIFDSQFGEYAQRQQLTVQKNSIDLYHSTIKAGTDDSLQKDADTFVDANEIEKDKIRGNAYLRIDAMMKAGVYSPEEALARRRNFDKEADVGSIIKIMRSNPDDVVRAIDNGEFKNLPIEMQEQWKTKAIERSELLIRRDNAESDRLERKARQEEREVGDQIAKDGWALHDKGQLSPDWVIKHQDDLGKDDFKTLLGAASGRENVHTDPAVAADLQIRASGGEDVRAIAKAAASRGQLTVGDMLSVIREVETSSEVVKGSNWQKAGKDYLNMTLAVNPNTATGFEKEMLAQAQVAWSDWAAAHPMKGKEGPTREQALKEAQSIADSAKALATSKLEITQLMPRYLKGARNNISRDGITQAYTAMRKDRNAGKIDEYTFKSESALLNNLLKYVPAELPKPPAGAK